METVAVKAAGSVVGKALGAVTGTLLEAWASSKGLGPNVDALKVELLYAQAMLDNTQGREIHSPALKELLLRLQQLAYSADDVLDEIEYFRIQDELDGTYHAADAHAGGCFRDLILNARHVAGAVAAMLKPSSCGSRHGHTISANLTIQNRDAFLASSAARVAALPPARMSRIIRSMADACRSWLPMLAPLHVLVEMGEDSSPVLPCLQR